MDPIRNTKRRDLRRLWMPAADYYFLSAAIAIGVFFIIWAILMEAKEANPWLPAGIAASALAVGAAVLREIVLRRRRNEIARAARLLDRSLLHAAATRRPSDLPRFTLEQNAVLIAEIKRKSDAANVLARIADSHREVFELCDVYLRAAESELPKIRPGSPRLAAIRKGTEYAARVHRFHMLRWAELELQEFTQNAAAEEKLAAKMSLTRGALDVIRTALSHYPSEVALLESQRLLQDTLTAMEVNSLTQRASRLADLGRFKIARKHFKKALQLVNESNLPEQRRIGVASEIEERMKQLGGLD
ncbi:MAG: hypothetical protein C4325_10635 [Blastocatellia bacterium]